MTTTKKIKAQHRGENRKDQGILDNTGKSVEKGRTFESGSGGGGISAGQGTDRGDLGDLLGGIWGSQYRVFGSLLSWAGTF